MAKSSPKQKTLKQKKALSLLNKMVKFIFAKDTLYTRYVALNACACKSHYSDFLQKLKRKNYYWPQRVKSFACMLSCVDK